MNSTILIASAIALLAFSHGVVILGKASRENHGAIYKIAGWFVIIASFLIMGCSVIHSAIGFYRWPYMHNTMEMPGNHMMNWFRSGDHYTPYHRYYDDNDEDRDYDRFNRRDRDNYRDNYRYGHTYNNNSDTSRVGR